MSRRHEAKTEITENLNKTFIVYTYDNVCDSPVSAAPLNKAQSIATAPAQQIKKIQPPTKNCFCTVDTHETLKE